MATKNLSITLTANNLYEVAESKVYVTGRTVYGHIVTATTIVNQKAVAGIITVTRTGSEHIDGSAGSASFTVAWTGLTPGSTIGLSGTNGMSGFANITNIAANGSTTVSFNYTSLANGSRDLTLTASGTDNNGTTRTDSGTYKQHGEHQDGHPDDGGSVLTVEAYLPEAPDHADVTATTVIFKVAYDNIWGSIALSPSVGTASQASITANGSGETNVTVSMGANTGHNSRDIILSATTTFNNMNDYATITQDGEGYNPDVWWTKTDGGSTKETSVNDIPAYVSGTYDGQDVSYTIYINYNSDVDTATITLDRSSLDTGVTINRSGKTVTLTVPVNENLSAESLGSITVNAEAPDGTTASATLSLEQVAGVSPEFSISPASQTIDADGTSANATLTYNYINPNSIAEESHDGNITRVRLS